MKTILIIEDNGSVSGNLKKHLEDYKVLIAYDYPLALDIWEEEKDSIDCIIMDLRISCIGIDLEIQNRYDPFYSLAILEEFCKGKSDEERRAIRKKTIIYSAYLEQLRSSKICSDININDITSIEKTSTSSITILETIKDLIGK